MFMDRNSSEWTGIRYECILGLTGKGVKKMPMAGSSLHRSKTSCKMPRRDIGGILKSRGEDLEPLKVETLI